MSVKTLNADQVFSTSALAPKRLTYSIAPEPAAIAAEESPSGQAGLEVFLENENPLGCIRGVFWVLAFNAIVFLTAFSAWAAYKYFW